MNTSCSNCVHNSRLEERTAGYDYLCQNAKPKAHVLVGAGRTTSFESLNPPELIEDRIVDYRLYMTHPADVTCEQFSPRE